MISGKPGRKQPQDVDATRRVPPQDLEAEKGVLGSILQDPRTLAEVRGILNRDHFYRDAHGIIYDAICRLADAGTPIDLLTIRAALKDDGKLDVVGGAPYLAEVFDSVPHAANAKYYAQIVHNAWRKRDLGILAYQTWADSYNGEDADALWNRLEDAVERRRLADREHDAPRVVPFEGWREQVSAAGGQPWLVEGMISPGWLVGLYGHGKEGKSRLAYHLIASLRTGADFLGRHVDVVPTIVLDYEGDEHYLADALGAAIDAKPPCLTDLMVANLGEHAPDPPYPLSARKLQAVLPSDLPPGFVLIDCARAAFSWGEKQECDSSIVGKDLRDLLRIARKTGWTVMIVQHLDKAGLGPRGSTEWTAAPDAYLIWSRPDAEQPGTLKIRGRIPPISPLSIELTPEAAIYRGTVARADRRENESRALGVLPGDAESALTVKEIVSASGLPDSTVRNALKGLRRANLAATVGKGVSGDPETWYALRSPTEAPDVVSFHLPIDL